MNRALFKRIIRLILMRVRMWKILTDVDHAWEDVEGHWLMVIT